MLLKHHSDSEELANIAIAKLRDRPTVENQQLLDSLIENSPIKRVQGIASYAKVMQLKNSQRTYDFYVDVVNSEVSEEEDEEAAQQRAGMQTQLDAMLAEITDEAEAIYENGETSEGESLESMMVKINDDYGDVAYIKEAERTLGDVIEPLLFELKYLAIGKTAPDIEGEDLDGEEFKLSDYRGKIVVIDFWGDW